MKRLIPAILALVLLLPVPVIAGTSPAGCVRFCTSPAGPPQCSRDCTSPPGKPFPYPVR